MTEYHTYTKAEFNNTLNVAVGGDIIYVHGVYNESMGVSGKTYTKHLIVDGTDAECKKGFAVTNSHYVTVRNFLITGDNGSAGFELNDTYHDQGLSNIIADGLKIYWASSRAIFQGGYNIHDITIRNCHIKASWNGTHGIYLTGAHYYPDGAKWPPCENFLIENNLIEFTPAGRHCIQFNGRFTNATIRNNYLRHANLGGISLIGCQHFDVINNVVYGNNRGVGVYIFDYAAQWGQNPDYNFNYFRTQDDIDHFREVHHPCQNILVENNTFVVGPKQFYKDKYHNNTPIDDPAVSINNAVHSGFWIDDPMYPGWTWIPHPGDEFNFPSKNYLIQSNVIYTINLNYIDTSNAHEATQTVANHNMVWSTQSGVPYCGGHGVAAVLNPIFGVEPGFVPPEYDHVDWSGSLPESSYGLLPDLGESFDKGFSTYFNPYAPAAVTYGVGRKYPVPQYAMEPRKVISGW